MDYRQYVKKLPFPSNFVPPNRLEYKDLVTKPLSRSDLKADMDAVNSSLELIRKTRGGTWPSEPVTEDFDFLDLAWHEREFRDSGSFAYVVYDVAGTYIGCFYLYPMGQRTELSEELVDYDVDVSWWVTAKAYDKGYYEKLFTAIQNWLTNFPPHNAFFSNTETPTSAHLRP